MVRVMGLNEADSKFVCSMKKTTAKKYALMRSFDLHSDTVTRKTASLAQNGKQLPFQTRIEKKWYGPSIFWKQIFLPELCAILYS